MPTRRIVVNKGRLSEDVELISFTAELATVNETNSAPKPKRKKAFDDSAFVVEDVLTTHLAYFQKDTKRLIYATRQVVKRHVCIASTTLITSITMRKPLKTAQKMECHRQCRRDGYTVINKRSRRR